MRTGLPHHPDFEALHYNQLFGAKIHNCPNCSCAAPLSHPHPNLYTSHPITSHPKKVEQMLMNVNTLSPKPYIYSPTKSPKQKTIALYQPLTSIYLNRGQQRNSSTGSNGSRNIIQTAAIPLAYVVRQPPLNSNNWGTNSRPQSPPLILRPLSPLNTSSNLSRTKVNIRYLNRSPSPIPQNNTNNYYGKMAVYNGQPRAPAILRKAQKARTWQTEESPIKSVTVSTIGNEGNCSAQSQTIYTNNKCVTTEPLKFNTIKYKERTEQQAKQRTTNTVNYTQTQLPNVGKQRSPSEYEHQCSPHTPKEISLNCDRFSEHQISDRSISDDVEL